jgi:PAS domain S-box-containing protein
VLRERERLLSSINANLAGTCVYRMVYGADGSMVCTYVSPNLQAMTGLAVEQMLEDARCIFRIVHPEDMPAFRTAIAEALRTGHDAATTARVVHPQRGTRWALFRSVCIERRADGGQVRDGVVVDITADRAAAEELRLVRQRLELALRASRTCIWEIDMVTNRVALDATWSEMLGQPAREVEIGWRALIAMAHPGDRVSIMAEVRRAARGVSDEYQTEQRIMTAQGGWIWILSHGRVTQRDAQGRALRMIGTNTDITQRKRAEAEVREGNANLERLVAARTAELAASTAELAESERLFRNLVEDINQGYFVANPRSLFTYCSPAVIAYAGRPAEALLGTSVFRIVAVEDRPRVIATYQEWMRAGLTVGKTEFRLADAARTWVEQTSSFVRDGAGRLVEIRSSVRNIAERKAAEVLLRQSNERFQVVFERSPIIMGLLTVPEGRLVEFNAAGLAAFGHTREESMGRTSVELGLWAVPEERERYLAELRAKRHVDGFEATMRRKNGETFNVLYSGSLIEIAGQVYSLNSIQDVSARRRAEVALRASEERLAHALSATSDGLWDWNIATGEVYFSPQWARLLGYEPAEVPARVEFFFEVLHPDDGGRVRETLTEHLEGRSSMKQTEVRLRTKAGDYRWYFDRGKVVARDASGAPTRMVGTITDITERKRAEEAVVHSLASLRATLESTADGILTIGADRRIESFNRPFVDMWQIAPALLAAGDDERVLGHVIDQSAEPEKFSERLRYLYEHPMEESFEKIELKDGRVFERFSRPRLVDGRATGRVWSFRDVTARQRAERRLAAFAKLGRELSAIHRDETAAHTILMIADQLFGWDSCTLDLYDAATDRCNSVLYMDVIDGRRQVCPPVYQDRAPAKRTRQVIQQGAQLILRDENWQPTTDETTFGDTSRRSASLMIVPLRDGANVVGVLSIQSYRPRAYLPEDLEALQALGDYCAAAFLRIHATYALASSEERLRLVWESVTDGMRLTDATGRIVAVNEAFCRMVGKPRAEIEGAHLAEIYQTTERERILARHRERFERREIPPTIERSITLWDGRMLQLEVTNRFIESDPRRPLLLGVFHDVTEQKLAEQERERIQLKLFQNQKFEALGTLAGGVAHDFNNILTGVINYTTLAREDCPPDRKEMDELLGEALRCAGRAKELVRQILLFSRTSTADRTALDLGRVVEEAMGLLRATLPADVEIRTELGAAPAHVLGNTTQIHQAVTNLGINAAHAMRERGGVLTVRLSRRELDAAQAAELQAVKAGPHHCLELSDNGTGMEPAVLARIFEPFFTTKAVGEGTGLGLAVVHSVVRGHQGAIAVRSRPGEGSVFELFFPEHQETPTAAPVVKKELPRGHGQHLLLVDDEEMVVKSLQLMLQRLGYTVTACGHPFEAWAKFEQGAAGVDLLLTDFQMPGMNGLDLSRKCLALRPDLPVFIASGFAGQVTPAAMRDAGVRRFFQKPVDFAELAAAIATVLRG